MKDILISNGFIKFKACSCGGTYAEKYKKIIGTKSAVIEIKPTRNTWSLKINAVFQIKGTKENLLYNLIQYELI